MAPPESKAPAGIDVGRLTKWMGAAGLASGPIEALEEIGGGTQNILVRFRAGREQYVLRRPPADADRADDRMLREARVLGLLADSEVPHARLVATCHDPDVLGCGFYLMEPVEGFNPTVMPPFPGDQERQHRLGLAMVDGLAAMSHVDVSTAQDLGRPAGWVKRQTCRWRKQLASYEQFEGYRGGQLDGVDLVTGWLDRNPPYDSRIGLIHGDFHFANVLVTPKEPSLAAIVDWELATLGDPLLDLGHLLATWPGGGPGSISTHPRAPGLPTFGELIERYAARSGRRMDEFRWYRVLACFRMAVLLEGSHARATVGRAPQALGDSCHHMSTALMYQARELVAGREA